jgi:hypothetical protein
MVNWTVNPMDRYDFTALAFVYHFQKVHHWNTCVL